MSSVVGGVELAEEVPGSDLVVAGSEAVARSQWELFRELPAVRSALEGAPDPVNGLIVYRGRGGGSGPRKPRKPRPAPGASAMALSEPAEERVLHLAGVAPPGLPEEALGRLDSLPRVKHPAGRCRMGG